MSNDLPKSSRRRRRKPEPEVIPPGDIGTEPRYDCEIWPWDEEIAYAFLKEVRQGNPVQALCREDRWPSAATLWTWREGNDQFHKDYFDAIAAGRNPEKDTADDSFEYIRWLGWAVLYDPRIDPKRAKIALDAFKWLAQKGNPAKFGNNLDLTNSDGSLSPAKIERFIIDGRTDIE